MLSAEAESNNCFIIHCLKEKNEKTNALLKKRIDELSFVLHCDCCVQDATHHQ